MLLLDVISATYTQHGAGVVDLVIHADLEDGSGPQDYPFTLTSWDDFGLSPEINVWMAANPNFEPTPYVAPPAPPPVDPEIEKQELLASVQASLTRLRDLGMDI